MRILFAGSPEFTVPVLERLVAEQEVVGVLTRPERAVGRGRRRIRPAAARAAEAMGLPVFDPEDPRAPGFLEQVRLLGLDLVAVFSFGRILSADFLALPRLGCFNLHASLLPEYRGASPVQSAIADGRDETGLTVFRMTPRMDDGPIVASRSVSIEPTETAGELLDRFGSIGAELLSEALVAIGDGTAVEEPQDEAKATTCRLLKKSDGRVDWSRSARSLVDHRRAMTPWPGSYTWLVTGRGTVRIVLGSVRESSTLPGAAVPGEIVGADETGIEVASGEGVVRIERLQPAGKRMMSAGDFLRGRSLASGERFVSEPL